MNTRLILLSADPDAPSTCLQVDAGGQLLQRMQLSPATSLAAPSVPAPSVPLRTVLVVPGSEARAMWLDLPARNPVQARAAAALLIEDHVATPRDRLHLSIAPRPMPVVTADGGEARRLVVMVDRDTMQHWLDRAAALGVVPDAVVPDHLMLPAPAGEAVCIAVLGDDRWLVRGEQLAFSAEPALAALVIGERASRDQAAGERIPSRIEDAREIERHFIASASNPPIDLLQGEFARNFERREGWPPYRRVAALAAVLAFSPLLLIAAQALRYEVAARQLESQAQSLVRDVVSGSDIAGDPLAASHAQLRELRSADEFARDVGALFGAVEGVRGARLDSLDYGGETGMRASLFHASEDDLQSIRHAVADAGLSLESTGTQRVEGGIRSAIVVGSGR